MMRLTSGYLRNSQAVSTTMLEASTSATSKERLGRTTRGIYTKSREPDIQKVAGAGGQSLQFKVCFLSGS